MVTVHLLRILFCILCQKIIIYSGFYCLYLNVTYSCKYKNITLLTIASPSKITKSCNNHLFIFVINNLMF